MSFIDLSRKHPQAVRVSTFSLGNGEEWGAYINILMYTKEKATNNRKCYNSDWETLSLTATFS